MKTFKQFLGEDQWYEDPQFHYGSNLATFKEKVVGNEGYRGKVYKDVYGNKTVGIGSLVTPELPKTLRTVFPDKPKGWEQEIVAGRREISRNEAEQLKDYQATQKFDEIRKALDQDVFDRLHNEVQVGLADAHFRGSMLGKSGSPKTMELIRQGNLRAAGKEFLNNAEYRQAKASGKLGGITKRMEDFSNTLIKHADYSNPYLQPVNRNQ
jgi:GH24 family phage-related lysozyme (muramidase)